MLKLDSLQQKPWYFQFAIFGFVALLIYGGFWYFITSGTREETKTLQAQVDQLQQENARAQIASQRLNDFKATYARAQADYEDLKALLPEQRELTTVLQGLQDRARGRLSVTRFTPKEDVQQDFYAGKPVEIEVSSSYNNLGAFFAQIAAYQRIVSISDFKVSRMKEQNTGRTVDAQFLLTAYYASSEKLQNTPKNPTQVPTAAPGAAPAAGAAQQPAPAAK
ncbi:MAG TPA: type 4a pilus biogenesis protein PilO [Pyrinomonadaceae bacterium]|nr:type 4a pilus biogenesis protein PilO [Pyrinomonadaceae bacterium]